ncbi:uncharacterized protein LOC114570240 [Perca flavescens]|uniref:uncharacterized protein LOC114570240 n=1 Tax=Perca flavescens TaxID=8167 RepID=UPI00106DFFB8|nr:uncharacterized protein LOC114570240 [Perca flavescens]
MTPTWLVCPAWRVKDDSYDYFQFIQEVSAKFNLPNEPDVNLQDSSGVDVDADIFDELVRSAAVSFKVSNEDSAEKEVSEASFCSDEGSFSPIESVRSFSSVESVSSGSTVITECTKARKRQLVEGPPDSKAAKDMVYVALHQKTGGEDIFKEYNVTKGLSDQTRRKLVNILVADMIESHGRVPPINVRVTYALGIVTLFPNLKDTASPTGYEHYYDPHSGQGYLAYRLKTVQRNTTSDFKRTSKSAKQHGPKTLAWIITVCKGLRPGTHVDDLLSAQEESNDYGWDSDLAAILLLVHLLPPTAKGQRHGKISATEATDHVVKFMKVGTSMVTFLERVGSAQPFLLCVGQKKSSIQKFYIILDQKAIPCVAQTAVAALTNCLRPTVFAVSYDEALCNFYTFIQTTVYGIDVGTTKESPGSRKPGKSISY